MTSAQTRFYPGPLQLRVIKFALFVLCLLPAALLIHGWSQHQLGANPVESILQSSGSWTLRMLLITLAVTPLRRLSGLHWLLRLRRMLGLFAFAWGCAHLGIYSWLEQGFVLSAVVRDVIERPFIAVGLVAFLLMLPLALTSSHASIRRLGGRLWQSVHRLVYVVALLGVIHFWWQAKADVLEPLIYAFILGVLLGLRYYWRRSDRRKRIAAAQKSLRSFRGIPIKPQ